jgi:hypothetical protein
MNSNKNMRTITKLPVVTEKLTVKERLAALKATMHTRSTKPHARLQASLAAIEYNKIVASLPGSAKRGLARGKAI